MYNESEELVPQGEFLTMLQDLILQTTPLEVEIEIKTLISFTKCFSR